MGFLDQHAEKMGGKIMNNFIDYLNQSVDSLHKEEKSLRGEMTVLMKQTLLKLNVICMI